MAKVELDGNVYTVKDECLEAARLAGLCDQEAVSTLLRGRAISQRREERRGLKVSADKQAYIEPALKKAVKVYAIREGITPYAALQRAVQSFLCDQGILEK